MVTTDHKFCSDHSRSLGEPAFATAPRIEAWILLEYPYVHPAKALPQSKLPEEIKEHLSAALDVLPHSRLLMIKKSNRVPGSGINLFLVLSGFDDPRLTRLQVKDYSEILSIDLQAEFAQLAKRPPQEDAAPLILVCTNGKRDACCARNGLPLFNEMKKHGRGHVWQSSHVGGHRFAANVISLPYGIYYGRIPISGAESFVEHCTNGEIDLPYYRGRTRYSAEQQAAEYLLRQHTGNNVAGDLQLLDSTQAGEDRWQINFKSREGRNYLVKVRKELTDYTIIESCGSPQKTEPQTSYQLEGIAVSG